MATPRTPASHRTPSLAPLAKIQRPPYRKLGARPRLTMLARRVSPRQIVLLALAATVGLIVSASVSRARHTTEQLGQTAPVVVVVEPLQAGASLTASNTEIRSWPIAFIPEGALRNIEEGSATMQPLSSGEVVITNRVTGASGLASDENAVVIPTLFLRDDLQLGDRVSLYSLEPIGSADQIVAAAARVLGTGRVVATSPQAVGVALQSTLVAPTLEAMAVGAVELVKLPG